MNIHSDFRNRPLPPAWSHVDTDEYKDVAIDADAAEYSEALVDLAACGISTASFYGDASGLNAPLYHAFESGMKQVYARESVAQRLLEVNGLLANYGVAVVVVDAFRPISVQRELWHWMLDQAKLRFPSGSPTEWEAYALRYASDPSNFRVDEPNTWPTHSTGGAVDLMLEELGSRKRLFMGSIYLDSSELSSTCHFENESEIDSASYLEARRNRRLLFWAMTSVGFVNYAFEWWHYDYLTQASVLNRGMPKGVKAHYGLANQGRSPEL